MKHLWITVLLTPFGALAQSIDLDWLNMPCATMLQCDSGCSACTVASNTSALFSGTGIAYTGVDICPESTGGGDNALATYGWALGVDSSRALFFTVIALQPVQVDSIIIRHRSSADGPGHVRISVGVNNGPGEPIEDIASPGAFADAVITDLGCVAAGPGMAYGFMKVHIRPYGSNTGSWELDEVRIVGSPCSITSVPELTTTNTRTPGPVIDVLGRRVVGEKVTGVYQAGGRRVVMVP